ncbi:hypothetical protein E2320_006033 [Naja naja]|nr:hypothetical protein E2320_006033 [Naja naja]
MATAAQRLLGWQITDSEKEVIDLAKADMEDTSTEKQTEEATDVADVNKEQTETIPLNEISLPSKQEYNIDSTTQELGIAEEPIQEQDAAINAFENLDISQEPVQEAGVAKEQLQRTDSAEDQTIVKESDREEELIGGWAVAEELALELESTGTREGVSEQHPDLAAVVPEGINMANLADQLSEMLKNAIVTVKFMLHPDIQIFTKFFNINQNVEQIKQYFAKRLKIPLDLLQIGLLGRKIENYETLWNLGVQPNGTIQFDMYSLDGENFPLKAYKLLEEYYMPDVITVQVQTEPDIFQDVCIEIKRPSFEKPFLGGFRHKETGIEYHNAGSQQIPKNVQTKNMKSSTAVERKKLQQTTNTTCTQMTKIGVYVSNVTDKLIEPKPYVTADEYHARRLKATIVIQTYCRRWLAIQWVNKLKEQLRLRLEWERQEELRKQREREEKLLREYNRRMHPKTKDDFELLYHALELWRKEELEGINNTFTGAERKAALCGLLEKETHLIACIGRHKMNVLEDNHEKAILSFLEKEHECKLTQEIVELIDREADLMMRAVKECNLQGLRQRICTLFLQYIKTPLFNPEVARLLKVPPDPMKLYHNIYFCLGCKKYLPSTSFAISVSSCTIGRCRLCCKLDNEARKRESFLKYKRMLRNLRDSEMKYNDGAKIAFILQLQDLHYMVQHFWGSQSALSAWDDLYDLVMVRWNKWEEWSPWNTVLLKEDEAEAHLKLSDLEKAYEKVFIHRVRHKQMLARNYFSQFPGLAAALHKNDKQTNTEDLLVTKSVTTASSK